MTAADLKSCCCLPLKKGCLGISVFTIIYALILLIIQINGLATSRIEYWPIFALIITGLGIAFDLLDLCAGIILLLGVTKEKPKLLQVWIIFTAAFILFLQIRIYQNLQYVMFLIPMVLFWTCFDIVTVLLLWYCLAVVYSFRKNLLSEQNPTMELQDPSAKPMVE